MKKGFTIVEIMVSVVLLGFISIFVSSVIEQAKRSNQAFDSVRVDDKKSEVLTDTLYKDLFQAQDIDTKASKRYSILKLKSKNSIYNIQNPYIVWLVLKKDNTLVRMESSKKILLPIQESSQKSIFIDTVAKNCETFNINISKDKKSILSFIKIKEKNPIIFEVKKL